MERIVAMEPFSSNSNGYISVISDTLRALGAKVVSADDPQLYSRTEAQRYVLLNWYDEVRRPSPEAIRNLCTQRQTRIAGYVQAGVHVVTFIHNRVPHDRPGDDILEASRRMRRLLCEKSDAIVGLCEQTREMLKEEVEQSTASALDKKFFVVPHPVYECYGVQPYANSKSPFNVGGNRFTFLFLGQVRPYKNIELILEVARVFLGEKIEAEFVIAGNSPTDYWRSLKTNAPANVTFLLGYVPDDEVVSLVSSADALILPYDVRSSLNSGSCMLAFSLKRTVVCPAIGTLQTVPKELVYSYSYTIGDQESHLRALTESARRAYYDMREDPLAFADKGRRLYWHVSRANSLQAVGDALKNIFEAVES